MKLQIFDKEGVAQSFDDLLTPLIETSHGEIDNTALVDHLDKQIRAKKITVIPDVEEMRRAILASAVADWQRLGQEDGVRRFLNDRKGHRFDRRAARIIDLDAERRQVYSESIKNYLFNEGPSAFRSQVDLLLLLDPSEDRHRLAERCSVAVKDAILKEDDAQETA